MQLRAIIKDSGERMHAVVVFFKGVHKYGKGWPAAIEELKKRAKADWTKIFTNYCKNNNIDPH